MTKRNYWLDLFTGATWNEFKAAGAQISGFRESRRATVQKIKPGDYLLCYLTGVSRFIGILEVTDPPYRDNSPSSYIRHSVKSYEYAVFIGKEAWIRTRGADS